MSERTDGADSDMAAATAADQAAKVEQPGVGDGWKQGETSAAAEDTDVRVGCADVEGEDKEPQIC